MKTTHLWLTVLTIALVFNAVMMRNDVEGEECTAGIKKEHLDTTPGAFVDNETIEIGSSGLKVKTLQTAQVTIFGTRTKNDTSYQAIAEGQIYQAQSDGILVAYTNGGMQGGDWIKVYQDSTIANIQGANPNDAYVVAWHQAGSSTGDGGYFCVTVPVKKDQYVRIKTENGETITGIWTPIGTGGLVKQ